MSFPWLSCPKNQYGYRKLAHVASLKARIGWQNLRTDEFIDEGPYCVTGTDLIGGKIDWTHCYHVSKDRYGIDENIQLQVGDLLVTKDGTIGKVAVVEYLPDLATLNSGVFVVRPTTQDLNTAFLKWVLQSGVFESFVNYHYAGSTISHLYQNVFEKFRFPWPSPETQKRIADFLDRDTARIDQLIEKKQRLVKLLKEKESAVCLAVVLGGRKPRRTSGEHWLSFMPEKWEALTLAQLVTSHGGATPSKDRSDFWSGKIPWISPKDMKRDFLDDSKDHISEKAILHSSLAKLDPGAILIVTRGMILTRAAPVALLKVTATINQDMKALVPGKLITGEYLLCMLQGLEGVLLSFVEEAAHGTKKLRTERLFKTRFPVPPIDQQDELTNRIF